MRVHVWDLLVSFGSPRRRFEVEKYPTVCGFLKCRIALKLRQFCCSWSCFYILYSLKHKLPVVRIKQICKVSKQKYSHCAMSECLRLHVIYGMCPLVKPRSLVFASSCIQIYWYTFQTQIYKGWNLIIALYSFRVLIGFLQLFQSFLQLSKHISSAILLLILTLDRSRIREQNNTSKYTLLFYTTHSARVNFLFSIFCTVSKMNPIPMNTQINYATKNVKTQTLIVVPSASKCVYIWPRILKIRISVWKLKCMSHRSSCKTQG